jgi:hypothetical protein
MMEDKPLILEQAAERYEGAPLETPDIAQTGFASQLPQGRLI